jgi:hypothetical protein
VKGKTKDCGEVSIEDRQDGKKGNQNFCKKLGHEEGGMETGGSPKITPARRTKGIYWKWAEARRRKNRKIKREQKNKE